MQNHTRGIYPGYYRTENFCKFCRTFIPVPGTSVSSVAVSYVHANATNTRGAGTAFLYLPGTSVSSVRPCHNTRNFCEFCNTSIPVPGTSVSCVRSPYPYPELLRLLQDRGTIPGVRVYLCYNTRGARYSFRFKPKSALCIMT